MAIGLSDGTRYEDEADFALSSMFNRMPLGSPTEPADALKSKEGTRVAGKTPIQPTRDVEDALYGHATGNMTPAQVRAKMPSGWSVDFRRGGKLGYEVTGPDGFIHYIIP